MNTEALDIAKSFGGEAENIRQMIAENSEKAALLMQQRVDTNLEAERAIMREQIEALGFSSDRAMANEMANRTLSKMFGSFSLIQKIIQNMG
jgi:hypothetical protein